MREIVSASSGFERAIPVVLRAVSAAIVGSAVLAIAPPFAASAQQRSFASVSVPTCKTSALVVWLDTRSTGVPGGWYYNLEFTNLSGHSCTLDGYPGVSAISLSGRQLGRAASWNPAHAPSVVTLSSGTTTSPIGRSDTATVVLKIADVSAYSPSACGYASAAGLRVYPPSQTTSTVVPYPFTGCSHTAPIVLIVEAVEPGIIPG